MEGHRVDRADDGTQIAAGERVDLRGPYPHASAIKVDGFGCGSSYPRVAGRDKDTRSRIEVRERIVLQHDKSDDVAQVKLVHVTAH